MTEESEKQEPVVVIFRKWREKFIGDGIIALFPEEPWNRDGSTITSYEHHGQHGSADYAYVISTTAPATPDEYAALKRELEQYPFNYNLIVRSRRPAH